MRHFSQRFAAALFVVAALVFLLQVEVAPRRAPKGAVDTPPKVEMTMNLSIEAVALACAGSCAPGCTLDGMCCCPDGRALCYHHDPNHCGSCFTTGVCSSNHITTPTCTNGHTCDGSCDANWGDCDADKLTNGCETDLTTVTDCVSCGHVCGATSTMGFTCSGGACQCNGVTCGKDQDCINNTTCTCTTAHIACPGDQVATDCDRSHHAVDADGHDVYECFNYNGGAGPNGGNNACYGGGAGCNRANLLICCPNGGGGTSCTDETTDNNCYGCGNVCDTGNGYHCVRAHGCCWNGAQCQQPPP